MSEKTPCQYCGKDVTVQAYGRKKHEEACKMNPVNEKVKDKAEEVPTEKLSAAQLEAKELYEISQKALEIRKESPELYIGGQGSDVRKELVRRYAPECIPPAYNPKKDKVRGSADWQEFFGDKKESRLYAHRGYEPVLNEHREQVTHDGDPLWRIPTDVSRKSKRVAEKRSRDRRVASDKTMKALEAGNSISGTGADISETIKTTTEVVKI
jgi:hypothetical protein